MPTIARVTPSPMLNGVPASMNLKNGKLNAAVHNAPKNATGFSPTRSASTANAGSISNSKKEPIRTALRTTWRGAPTVWVA